MNIEDLLEALKDSLEKGFFFSTEKGQSHVIEKRKKCVEAFDKLQQSCERRSDRTSIEKGIKSLKEAMRDVTKKDPCSNKKFKEIFDKILEMAAVNYTSNQTSPQSPAHGQTHKRSTLPNGSERKGPKQQISKEITGEVLNSMKWTAEMDLTKPNSGISNNYVIGDKIYLQSLHEEERYFLKTFTKYMYTIIDKIDRLNKVISDLQNEIDLKRRSEVSDRQPTVVGRPQTSRVQQEERDIHMKKQLEKALQENHILKTRISKMAGVQLTHQNAAIADLSDPNRPTKIAEKYAELYDNSWTDAMEELQKDCKNEKEIEQSEKLFISRLRDDLQRCYNFCKEKSEKQLEDIQNVLFLAKSKEASNKSGSLSKEFHKEINETRKCTAPAVVEVIQKEFIESDANPEKSCREYLKDCLELCWYMVVQDPPVCLHFGDQQHGSVIDTARFDFYTRSGKQLDFLVWPALRLEAGGALLRKGVAQPLP